VVAFADFRRNVDAPVGLSGVDGKRFPAVVILQSNAAWRSCDRLRRITVATWSNAFCVSALQQEQQLQQRQRRQQQKTRAVKIP